jgi:hypothetical protein
LHEEATTTPFISATENAYDLSLNDPTPRIVIPPSSINSIWRNDHIQRGCAEVAAK